MEELVRVREDAEHPEEDVLRLEPEPVDRRGGVLEDVAVRGRGTFGSARRARRVVVVADRVGRGDEAFGRGRGEPLVRGVRHGERITDADRAPAIDEAIEERRELALREHGADPRRGELIADLRGGQLEVHRRDDRPDARAGQEADDDLGALVEHEAHDVAGPHAGTYEQVCHLVRLAAERCPIERALVGEERRTRAVLARSSIEHAGERFAVHRSHGATPRCLGSCERRDAAALAIGTRPSSDSPA